MASDWYKQKIMEPLIKGHVESGNYTINDAERNYLKAAGYTEDDFLNYVGSTTNGMTFGEYAIYRGNQAQKNALIGSVDKNLQDSYNIIDQNVAAQKGILDNNLATNKTLLEAETSLQKADLDEAYEKNVQAVDVQRRLNERYLERKAAEMGNTNSGLSRTQLTANQLSAGNAINDYGVQRQKAIDSLDAAMKAQMLQYQTQYNNDVATLDMNAANQKANLQMEADNQKAQIEAGYIDSAKTQYVANQKAQIEAEEKAVEKTETTRKNAYSDIYSEIKALDLTSDKNLSNAAWMIQDFLTQYDPDGDYGYGKRLLALLGISESEYEKILAGKQGGKWYENLVPSGYESNKPWYAKL